MEVIGSHTYVLRYRSQVSTPIEKWPSSLIAATRRYVEKLLRCRTEPELAEQDLRTFVAKDLAACSIFYFAPYEAVHRQNIIAVTANAPGGRENVES